MPLVQAEWLPVQDVETAAEDVVEARRILLAEETETVAVAMTPQS